MPQYWRFLEIFSVFYTVWIKLENSFFKKKEFATQQVCLIKKKKKSMPTKKKRKSERETGTEREIQYLSILDKLCLEIFVI